MAGCGNGGSTDGVGHRLPARLRDGDGAGGELWDQPEDGLQMDRAVRAGRTGRTGGSVASAARASAHDASGRDCRLAERASSLPEMECREAGDLVDAPRRAGARPDAGVRESCCATGAVAPMRRGQGSGLPRACTCSRSRRRPMLCGRRISKGIFRPATRGAVIPSRSGTASVGMCCGAMGCARSPSSPRARRLCAPLRSMGCPCACGWITVGRSPGPGWRTSPS